MFLRILAMTAIFLAGGSALLAPMSAKAEPKMTYWSWWPEHWENLDWQPYLEDSKQAHNSQWDQKKWEPADWAAQKPGGSAEIIRGFYNAEILSGQYIDDEMPVLEVGPNFYHLSGYDKRRVAETVDDYYQITASKLNGMYMIYDWRSKKPIGSYTAHGLQIQ